MVKLWLGLCPARLPPWGVTWPWTQEAQKANRFDRCILSPVYPRYSERSRNRRQASNPPVGNNLAFKASNDRDEADTNSTFLTFSSLSQPQESHS